MRFLENRRDTGARRFLKRGLLALVAALGVLALGPASALATHFTNTTKRCNTPTGNYECVLDITMVPPFQTDTLIIDLQGNATYATTPTRTGGNCSPTTVNVVSPTRLNVPINFTSNGTSTCTIVLQETLTATGGGGFPCQVLDLASGENVPPFVACATLASPPIQPLRPTSKDQCKDGEWRNFGSTFKNQGDCVSFAATGGRDRFAR